MHGRRPTLNTLNTLCPFCILHHVAAHRSTVSYLPCLMGIISNTYVIINYIKYNTVLYSKTEINGFVHSFSKYDIGVSNSSQERVQSMHHTAVPSVAVAPGVADAAAPPAAAEGPGRGVDGGRTFGAFAFTSVLYSCHNRKHFKCCRSSDIRTTQPACTE